MNIDNIEMNIVLVNDFRTLYKFFLYRQYRCINNVSFYLFLFRDLLLQEKLFFFSLLQNGPRFPNFKSRTVHGCGRREWYRRLRTGCLEYKVL